jgi:hypothetical protein
MTIVRYVSLVLLGLILSGCSTTITNLTPSKQVRNSTGLYPVELLYNSNQKTLRKDTVQPYVLVGLESHPLQPAPVLNNRWETLIEVPTNKTVVNYRFKLDYQYSGVPQRRSGSILSAPYQLEIVGK